MSAPGARPFLREVRPDPDGLIGAQSLPVALPYGLQPRDVLRTVEDVQRLLHRANAVFHDAAYAPLEDLLDRASFSGLISRTVAARLAAASQILVVNGYHNGYPDLIRMGEYPNDAVQRGVGLEVKASRSEGSWQSHGPRPGWFCVVQFAIDERADLARLDRDPTMIQCAMPAELSEEDWSWTPARSGRIRSGTASVTQSGRLKLREGAVWIDPGYRARHDELIANLRLAEFRHAAPERVLSLIAERRIPTSARDIAGQIAEQIDVPFDDALRVVQRALSSLRKDGRIVSGPKRGDYLAADTGDALQKP